VDNENRHKVFVLIPPSPIPVCLETDEDAQSYFSYLNKLYGYDEKGQSTNEGGVSGG
jgi:hypothetical protein